MHKSVPPPVFSRLIHCATCSKKFKAKIQRKKRVYVCSTYGNYSNCKRNMLHEELLKELVYRRHRQYLSDLEIRAKVEGIIVEENGDLTIYLKEGMPIVYSETYMQY